jgi:DNA-binding response OmpR family regulator
MSTDKRDAIRRSLLKLVESYTVELVEQTMALLDEAVSEPVPAYSPSLAPKSTQSKSRGLLIDGTLLTVTFRGRTCFLGNTLPFRLLARLAKRPNAYVPHQVLLDDVWQGPRSDSAIRSVVKVLRSKLRKSGLGELADAITGSQRGHYVLRLQDN